MYENPYESPPIEDTVIGVRSGNREDLKSVATYQKGLLVCILIYLTSVALHYALPPELRLVLALMILFVILVGAAFVFLLATKVYPIAIGILLGIIALIPCIGLIALLAVNGKATDVLRKNGIQVGLMGAKLSDI